MAKRVADFPLQRIVSCSHSSFAGYSKDFSELWLGAPESKPSARGTSKRWSGGFTGRPELADGIWPELRDFLAGKKRASFNNTITALRAFWRFLENYEKHGFGPLQRLTDVTTALSILWLNPIDGAWSVPSPQAYETVGQFIRRARARAGLSGAWAWHPYPSVEITNSKELPTERQVREAMHLLKQTAYRIYARWSRADSMAADGRNMFAIREVGQADQSGEGWAISLGDELTEADAHATYRAYIESSGNPLPSMPEIFGALGVDAKDFPQWWPKHGQDHPLAGQFVRWDVLVAGLYPTSEDIDCLSQLCMARSGWNPATLFALDTSSEGWASPHGESGSTLWLIESLKNRGNTWQWTVSPQKLSTGFYHIVKTLLLRTEPLRRLAARDPGSCIHRDLISTSCWIFAGRGRGEKRRIGIRSDHNGSYGSDWWKRTVREHNKTVAPEKQIPESMTPSDWRDVYASFVFHDSRYSWVLVQWALGHKHVSTTRHYLRRLLWRRYSEKKLAEVQIVLIDGIEAHGRVDAVIIRAKVDLGVEPSVLDIERLDAHRRTVHERELSYSGYGCVDRLHPPPEIDPGNPCDGSMPCRRGERCPLCPQGLAIDAYHMCKSLAELRWLRRQVNATVWMESDYAARLDVLEVDLKQWPADEVNRNLAYWADEIGAGRLKVIRFGSRQ